MVNVQVDQQTGTASTQINDDFFGRVLHLTARLRDHIERMDQGVVYAVDDLAVVLRAFLHPKPGNDVLRRLSARAGVEVPRVLLSAPPVAKEGTFSFGSVPTRYSGATEHGASWTDINEWPNTPAIEGDIHGAKFSYTWAGLLNVYANKWGGAHLDDKVPTQLLTIDMYAAAGYNLSGYLIRAAAVEVWMAAQYMLSAWASSAWGHGWTGRVYPPGALVERDPADLSARGQLQWFSGNRSESDFLWYVDPKTEKSDIRVLLAGTPRDLEYSSETGTVTIGFTTAETVERYQAPRQMPAPSYSAEDFHGKETTRLYGRVLPYPDTDPGLWIARPWWKASGGREEHPDPALSQ